MRRELEIGILTDKYIPKVLTDELINHLRSVGSELEDEVPLIELRPRNPVTMSMANPQQQERWTHHPHPEWTEMLWSLENTQQGVINNTVGKLISFLNSGGMQEPTVGDLRSTSIENLLFRVKGRPFGWPSIVFAKMVFTPWTSPITYTINKPIQITRPGITPNDNPDRIQTTASNNENDIAESRLDDNAIQLIRQEIGSSLSDEVNLKDLRPFTKYTFRLSSQQIALRSANPNQQWMEFYNKYNPHIRSKISLALGYMQGLGYTTIGDLRRLTREEIISIIRFPPPHVKINWNTFTMAKMIFEPLDSEIILRISENPLHDRS